MDINFDAPRAPTPEEMPLLLKFLNKELRPEQAWSIEQEYPAVFDSKNCANIRVIRQGDEVLAHAAIRPFIVKSPVGLIKVAAIGSVVTSSEFRSQGLSRRTLESCLDAAAREGCDLAILWTDLYDFYRKLDFELAGTEITIEIEDDFVPPPMAGIRFMFSSQVSAQALLRVFHQHTVTSLRKVEDIEKALKIPNTRVYTAWDQNNKLLAYAIEGKGVDLEGYIHEWGGSVPALMNLFAHIRNQQKKCIRVIVPGHSQNLIRKMTEAGAQQYLGFLGMLRWIAPERFFNKVRKYAYALGMKDFVLEATESKLTVGRGTSRFETDRPADFIPLFFGPQKAHDWSVFEPEMADYLEKIFPLPFWVWGWDSI